MKPGTLNLRPSVRSLKIFYLYIGGFICCIFAYLTTSFIPFCQPGYNMPYQYSEKYDRSRPPDKPVLLLWFWPENNRFNLSDCRTLLGINGCILTDDRSLYSQSDAVLIFHKAIYKDRSNLPRSPRPPFQRWIWFHMEPPSNTLLIRGLENLFNLTLSYRQDADIPVQHQLSIHKHPDKNIDIPNKNKLVCISDASTGNRYYRELRKHIKVHVFGNTIGKTLNYSDYYSTIASCRFYLAFEDSIDRDYITDKVNEPLSVGTVPVVSGPPRENYETLIPGDSFIHVNDFPSVQELVEYLLDLDEDTSRYHRYFHWRRHFSAKPHFITKNQEFMKPICTACEYLQTHYEYRDSINIYKWYFS